MDKDVKRCVNYFPSPVFKKKNGEVVSCTEGKMNLCLRLICFCDIKKEEKNISGKKKNLMCHISIHILF